MYENKELEKNILSSININEILLDIIAIVDTTHDFYNVDTSTQTYLNTYFKKFYISLLSNDKLKNIIIIIKHFFDISLINILLNLFKNIDIVNVNRESFKNIFITSIISSYKKEGINLNEINKKICKNFYVVFNNCDLNLDAIDKNEIIKIRQLLYFLIDDFKNNRYNISLLENILNYFKLTNIITDTLLDKIKSNIENIEATDNVTYPLTYFDDMSSGFTELIKNNMRFKIININKNNIDGARTENIITYFKKPNKKPNKKSNNPLNISSNILKFFTKQSQDSVNDNGMVLDGGKATKNKSIPKSNKSFKSTVYKDYTNRHNRLFLTRRNQTLLIDDNSFEMKFLGSITKYNNNSIESSITINNYNIKINIKKNIVGRNSIGIIHLVDHIIKIFQNIKGNPIKNNTNIDYTNKDNTINNYFPITIKQKIGGSYKNRNEIIGTNNIDIFNTAVKNAISAYTSNSETNYDLACACIIFLLFNTKRFGDYSQAYLSKKYYFLVQTTDKYLNLYLYIIGAPVIINNIIYNYKINGKLEYENLKVNDFNKTNIKDSQGKIIYFRNKTYSDFNEKNKIDVPLLERDGNNLRRTYFDKYLKYKKKYMKLKLNMGI